MEIGSRNSVGMQWGCGGDASVRIAIHVYL